MFQNIWSMLFPIARCCLFCPAPMQINPYAQMWERICFTCQRNLVCISTPICQYCGRTMECEGKNVCSDCKRVPMRDRIYNRSVFEYSAFVKRLVWRYKYKGDEQLAWPLGRLMSEQIQKHWQSKSFVISYVPLHKERLAARGFNQAELLAQVCSRELRLPLKQLLRRKRITHQQSSKGRMERLTSLAGAFELCSGIKLKQYRDKPVLLIDDIYTTGTTLRECAVPLRRLGIQEIYSMTLAR